MQKCIGKIDIIIIIIMGKNIIYQSKNDIKGVLFLFSIFSTTGLNMYLFKIDK